MRIEKGILVFADTDFLSSFLRVGLKDFLVTVLRDNDLKVPYSVACEINDSHMPNLINEFQYLINNSFIEVLPQIPADSDEFDFMIWCSALGDKNYPEFGEGELEAITYAKFKEGYVASNNLKHIRIPCEDLHIKYFTTTDILLINIFSLNILMKVIKQIDITRSVRIIMILEKINLL